MLKATPSLRNINQQSRNLQHSSWEVRAEAADFFGSLGSESVVLVVPMLQDLLLKDDSWHVRQHAADALQDLGAEAVSMAAPTLQKVTKEDAHYTVRLAAAVALRKHGHKAEAALPLTQDEYAMEQEVPAVPKLEECFMQPQDKLDFQENKPGFLATEETRLSSFGDISDISVQSPQRELAIVVDRGASGKWGIDVDFVVHGTCLRVSRVKDGAIADWNKEHPEALVEVGDLLIELNGISGDSKELVKVICKAEKLEMIVQKGA